MDFQKTMAQVLVRWLVHYRLALADSQVLNWEWSARCCSAMERSTLGWI
jgi:hypothetical protein